VCAGERDRAPRRRRAASRGRSAPHLQSRTRDPAQHSARARRRAGRDRAPRRERDAAEGLMVESPVAVVLLNMGGPDSLEAVEPFLFNLFADHDLLPLPLGFLWQRAFARMVSRRRAVTVREYYKMIGGRSPLGEITAEQAKLLEARLSSAGTGVAFTCHVAMRYTPPFTRD